MQIIDLPYGQYPPHAVAARFIDHAGTVFLDSAARNQYGRYSFVAGDPFAILTGKNQVYHLIDQDGEQSLDEPWAAMRSFWANYRLPLLPELPPLQGGLIGFWSYDLGRRIERVPSPRVDDLYMPDLWLGAYDWVLAWDHQTEKCWLISTGLPEQTAAARHARAEQRAHDVLSYLADVANTVRFDVPASLMSSGVSEQAPLYSLHRWPGINSTFTPQRYQQAVQQAIAYIYAGDAYQINLSQRLEAALQTHPWHLYSTLREHNPAPFAAYLNFGDSVIASASPERFLLLQDGIVETRPIKGTISRIGDPLVDKCRSHMLQTSTKDRAENLMIVDLLRNDIGRVCEIGSVHVPELWAVEEHPTVYHLVSTVRGRLREELTPFDLLHACFPGGSITGAPKIRAMEIISELEPTTRGPYCGALGYVGWNGQMDTNILIRTMIARQGRVVWQVGGGIVADSTPEGEYEETLAKARAWAEVMVQQRHACIS